MKERVPLARAELVYSYGEGFRGPNPEDEWAVALPGGRLFESLERETALQMAADINAAVEAREVPLLALAIAMEEYIADDRCWNEAGTDYDTTRRHERNALIRRASDVLGEADPPEWVPLEQHRKLQAQMVALEKDVTENVWRARHQRLGAALAEAAAMVPVDIYSVFDHLAAIVAGDEKPPPMRRQSRIEDFVRHPEFTTTDSTEWPK